MERYNRAVPRSIEHYAQKLIGHTFQDVIDWAELEPEAAEGYSNASRKGGLGNLLEERFFFYKANSESEPDFKEAGVELKATPYERRKDGSMRAGERVSLTMISYADPVEPEFYKSHLWRKCKLILFIYYWRRKELEDNLLYRIDFVKLFTPPQTDLKIIEHDYQIIIQKIQAGKAHEISESDTLYLGAATKGATALSSTVPQYYPPHIPARKRAFCYKSSYMTFVLNNYIAADVDTYEPIIKDVSQLEGLTFEEYIVQQINRYIGRTDAKLSAIFGRKYDKGKSQWIELAYDMLGIKSNRAAEFVKANIVVKAIRLEENGTMRESSPLPTISFRELIDEEWEESNLYSYFNETKFLFVVFKRNGENYVLKGAQLWNMAFDDLNSIVYSGWKQTQKIAREGIILQKKKTKKGWIVENNLPSKSDNPIIHIRPHTSKTFYKLEDGEIIGNGSYTNGDELPDGRWMTKQSFWLNNTYVVSQLKDYLKD